MSSTSDLLDEFNKNNPPHDTRKEKRRAIEDFIHLIGDGWLTEAFDLKDGDKLVNLIEHCEDDVEKELKKILSAHYISKADVLKALDENDSYNEMCDECNNWDEGRNDLRQKLKKELNL